MLMTWGRAGLSRESLLLVLGLGLATALRWLASSLSWVVIFQSEIINQTVSLLPSPSHLISVSHNSKFTSAFITSIFNFFYLLNFTESLERRSVDVGFIFSYLYLTLVLSERCRVPRLLIFLPGLEQTKYSGSA